MDLPDELLIKIVEATPTRRTSVRKMSWMDETVEEDSFGERPEVSKYDNTSLLHLALTSRRLSGIAQEVLVRELHINKANYFKLPNLVPLFFKRPRLAQMVKTFTLDEIYLDYSVEGSYPYFRNRASQALDLIKADLTAYDNLQHALLRQPSPWVFLLISFTPNLQKFRLRYHNEGHFIDDVEGYINNSPFTPTGLHTIRELDLNFNCHDHVHSSLTEPIWLDLPQLQRLSIVVPNSVMKDVGKHWDLKIHTLELRVEYWCDDFDNERLDELSNFFSRCKKLKHLKIHIELEGHWLDHAVDRYLGYDSRTMEPRHLVQLLNQIMSLREPLESFDLAFSAYQSPLLPFAATVETDLFPLQAMIAQVRHLTLPQAVLLCTENKDWKSEPWIIYRMLPRTLETLVVRCVDIDAVRIYKYLLDHLDDFPHLSLFVVERQKGHQHGEVWDFWKMGFYTHHLAKVISDRLPVRIEDAESLERLAWQEKNDLCSVQELEGLRVLRDMVRY